MAILKSITFSCLILFMLVSCGGDRSEARVPSYDEMVGIWESVEENAETHITIIRDDASYTVYNKTTTCYEYLYQARVDVLGDGDFVVNVDNGPIYQLHVTISGNTLYVSNPTVITLYVKTDLLESQIIANVCT